MRVVERAAGDAAEFHADGRNEQTLMTAIGSHSMLSWAHVNLLGEYYFSDEKLKNSFGLEAPQAGA